MIALEKDINFEKKTTIKAAVKQIYHQEVHYHSNAIEMIFCLQGSISMRSSHRHVTLYEGDVFSIDPGDIHCIYSDTDNLVLFIHINIYNSLYSKETIYNCFFACETQPMSPFQIQPMYQVKDIMLSAALCLFTNSTFQNFSLKTASDKLIDLLIKHFDWLSFIWDPMGENTIFKQRIDRTLDYCLQHYPEKITLSQLAEQEHINSNYFSAFFKKTSFYNFSSLLSFIRCDAAEHLLLTTNKNVIEIASLCGFSDPKYFYKHFNDWWHMSPAKLRKWYLEYNRAPAKETKLSDDESFKVIKDYLCGYTIQRTFLY